MGCARHSPQASWSTAIASRRARRPTALIRQPLWSGLLRGLRAIIQQAVRAKCRGQVTQDVHQLLPHQARPISWRSCPPTPRAASSLGQSPDLRGVSLESCKRTVAGLSTIILHYACARTYYYAITYRRAKLMHTCRVSSTVHNGIPTHDCI